MGEAQVKRARLLARERALAEEMLARKAERDAEGHLLRCQARRCGWFLKGRAADPVHQPMGCSAQSASLDARCAVHWIDMDPEDRPSYDAYLAAL